MRSRSRGGVIALSACLAAHPAFADALSMPRAVAMALASNPELRVTALAQAEAREHQGEARAGWFPRIELQEGWQRGDQPVFAFSSLLAQRRFAEADFAIATLNHPNALSNHRASVVVRQSIFDGGDTRAARATAAAGLSSAATAGDRKAADIAVAVARAYMDAMTSAAAVRAAAAAIEAASADLARVEAQQDEGMVTDADVLTLRVHLAQAQARQASASGDSRVAMATLNSLMGVGLDSSWDLIEPAAPSAAIVDVSLIERAALDARPDVREASTGIDRARATVDRTRAARLPRVNAEGGYEWNGASWINRGSAWLVGVQAAWTVSMGGADASRGRAAAQGVERAKAERAVVESAARLDIRRALARLDAARTRQAVGSAAVAQAREGQRIIRDRYTYGLAGAADVVRAAEALLDAEHLATTGRADLVVAAVELDRARGMTPRSEP